MSKRVAALAAMIVTALGVGVGVTSTSNPTAQVAMVVIGCLLIWAIVRVLGRAGEIWRFTAPYPEHPRMERRRAARTRLEP